MTTSPATPDSDLVPERTLLHIDVWADLACPWCYLGKHRLDQAIAASPHAQDVTVTIHSFELDPSASREAKPTLDVLAAKYGLSPADAQGMEDRIADMARDEGLPFTSQRVIANSFDVHRVLHLAAGYGLDDALLGALQRALFSGERNTYDPTVLADIASQVGIPRARVDEVLAGDEFADAVRADEAQAAQLGVTGVPFTVFDRRLAVPGATSVAGFAGALEQALAR